MHPRPLGTAAILALFVASSASFAQTFSVVSAASYQPTVAPDSLATMFGVNLAASTQSATLDADGKLPTQLAGTTVTVDGRAASLIYVSPGQVNFLIPAATTPGTVSVVVQSSVTGGRQSANIQVAHTAPGVFTNDASGTGPGSILNAVTYAAAPFLVETPENGSDQRTRLAIYGTGLRFAGNPGHDEAIANVGANVQARGQDAEGTRYHFAVEYAGAAPGYFGLDQVNIVLPPDLDGAGLVTLTVTADGSPANPVTFRMGSLPATSIRLTGLAFSSAFVEAGDSVNATVSLNAPARAAGLPVSLRSSSPIVQLPFNVTVPAGQSSAQFPITASSTVTSVQTATITAQAGGVIQTATLEVEPPNALQLVSLTVSPSSVQGGRSTSATVGLSGTAPAGGAVVQIRSDSAVAQAPATVTIPFAASTATFSVATTAVSTTRSANITATLGRNSRTTILTVAPALQLALPSSAVIGGNSVSGTVTLGDPAPPAGVTVNLRSDNATIAQTPVSVSIPGGQTSTTFLVTTIVVTVSRTVTVTASLPNSAASATASLAVNPVGSGTLATLTVAPAQVIGGANALATVTLTAAAPPGGTVVTVMSNSPYARVPQLLVTVPPGLVAATFTISTTHPPTPQTATITATAGGVTRTATLSIQ